MSSVNKCRISLFGLNGVGATALSEVMTFGKICTNRSSIGVVSYGQTMDIDRKTVSIEIIDGLNQGYWNLFLKEIADAKGCLILVYSIDSRYSFENIVRDYQRIRSSHYNFPILLCGNKCDLEDKREVTREEGEEKANQFGCKFFETSALNNTNVISLFETAVREIKRAESRSRREEIVPKPLRKMICLVA